MPTGIVCISPRNKFLEVGSTCLNNDERGTRNDVGEWRHKTIRIITSSSGEEKTEKVGQVERSGFCRMSNGGNWWVFAFIPANCQDLKLRASKDREAIEISPSPREIEGDDRRRRA